MTLPDDHTPVAAPPLPDSPISALIDRHMLEALICPLTHGPLSYEPQSQELISRGAGLAFPIREGIPIMLEIEARILPTR